MHELSITRNIVAIVSERAHGAKVTRVTLEIGQLSAVVPDAIRFCFDVVAKGTVLEGARLDVVEVPGRGRCRDCGQAVELHQVIARCPCGSPNLDRLSGEELTIKQMVTA
ncbi:MAG TPA: hydrogenase maturation nickel metallochaperone HypA [Nitrospira sp.]|nr:hydrogenase maturation nickel metallochaperone HypA [Nitrospira sp.]